MKVDIRKVFSGWKLVAAIIISLGVSFWMLYSNVNQTTFIEVVDNSGTHSWQDSNANNKVDFSIPEEFIPAPGGQYKASTMSSEISNLSINTSAWLWLIAAILFTVGRDFFYMVRIRILSKKKLNWRASFFVIMLWEFASALSPGVVGGAAVAMFILNRESIPMGKATAMVIITAFMDNLFFVLMIPIILIFINQETFLAFEQGQSLWLSSWFWIGYGVISSVCFLLYYSIFWRPNFASKFLNVLFKLPLLRNYKVVALEWGKDIEVAAKQFKREHKSFWMKTFLATFASWTSRYLVINAILNAFLSLGFFENIQILGKQLVLWLFMLISPTPGGSGVAEFAFGELLSGFGGSALLIAVLALIWRLISYFPYLIIGATLLPVWLRRTS